MARTFIRQDIQIGSTNDTLIGFNDAVSPAATMESGAGTVADDLNNLRSMVSNLIDVQAGNWYTDANIPATLETGVKRGVNDLNSGLHAVEKKRILRDVHNLVDVCAGAAATGTLTAGGQPANDDTVTIGSQVYTWKTVLTGAADEVFIGGTVALSLENLRRAINADGVAGTNYGTGTVANADVTATDTATTVVATAIIGGTAGNSIATTESGATTSWGGATLSGGLDANFLILGTGELPTQTIAAVGLVSTLGTVVAAHTGTFGTHSLDEVAGSNALSPLNLMLIVDGDTRDPILSAGREVWGLLQSESATDGHTITDATTTRVQISFVVENATGDDLIACPVGDISGKCVDYTTRERVRFEDLNEADFLRGAIVDIGAGTGTVDLQTAYDNQGSTPIDSTTNVFVDLEGPGIKHCWRDDLEAELFCIIEGSAGGTTQIAISSDVDTFNVDAVVNDFANGVTVNSDGTRPIQVGVTDGVIESTAGNLRVNSADELYLDDVNQTGSTWAQTDGIKLSETTAEWDAFETAFGEVSLLNAITQAYAGQIRTKVQATVTSNVTASNDVNGPGTAHANTDVDLAPFNNVTFNTDVDVFLNGELMRHTDDVVAGGTPADGDLQFLFNLKGTGTKPDQITVIVNGQ